MRLYDAPWAPSPRRVRIFLAEKGIEIERVMLDLRQDEHFSDAYLAINPRGTVPALQLDDGEVITESAAICRYLEALYPNPALFGESPIEAARIDSWTRRIENEGYTAAVYAFRNSKPQMEGRGAAGKWPPIPIIPELATRGAIMWDDFTQALDAHLVEHQWIAGDRFSFADITALVTMDFARSAKLTSSKPGIAVARWYDAASKRPSAAA